LNGSQLYPLRMLWCERMHPVVPPEDRIATFDQDGTLWVEHPLYSMPQPNDLSRSLVALDQNSTIIAAVELSQSSWLVAGMLRGIDRQPRNKLEPSPERLLGLLHRWQDEAVRANVSRAATARVFSGRILARMPFLIWTRGESG
jgi:hypothetical protein